MAGANEKGARVRSLRQALDQVQTLRRTNPAMRNIHIEMAPGEHRFEQPVTIDAGHGGSRDWPLVIRGPADAGLAGPVRLLGSRRLELVPATSSKVRSALDRPEVPAEARPRIKRYALPPRIKPGGPIDTPRPQDGVPAVPFEIFDVNGPLWPARWPNLGRGTAWSKIAATGGTAAAPSFTIADDRARNWRNEPDLWAGGYWQYDWRYETQRVSGVDQASGSMTLAARPFDGLRAGARVFVYHALAELDQPGEWYRDRGTNELLVWPRTVGNTDQSLEISLAEGIIHAKEASHIRLRGLSFEMTRSDAVIVKGGRDVVIEDCRIRWTGGRAAVFEDTIASGILRSRISDTGAGGTLLYGGNRQELTPAGLFALDSRFERFARLSFTYAAAVELGGVGHTVSGNYISNSDHLGILFQGNDHLIERNELARLMLDSADGGAIYTGRDWTSRGTRIRHNFLHDIKPAAGFETKGVYLDDMASGIAIEGNVFLRVDQAVFIGGGRDNSVNGNVFAATEPAVHIDSRGLNDHRAQIENPASEMLTRLKAVPYRSPLWQARYPTLADILDDQPGMAKRNVLTGNIYLSRSPYEILSDVDHGQQTLGPNMGLADVGPGLLERVGRLQRASEVGGVLRGAFKSAPVHLIPFESLDRDEHLQRRSPW
jgi:Right handed beta helix region